SYPKQLRWHFLREPKVEGDSFEVAAGGSKLFGRTFSAAPLKTVHAPVKVGRATVGQLITQNAAAARRVRYVTVFQVAPASAGSGAAAERVVSTDARMEGARVGDQVVLFARDVGASLPASITYRFGAAGPTRHLLTDLRPGRKYRVTSGSTLKLEATASTQGTLSFTTPAGERTVTVTVAS